MAEAKSEKIYSPQRMRKMIEDLSQTYDLVRLVDAEECRVLNIDEEG